MKLHGSRARPMIGRCLVATAVAGAGLLPQHPAEAATFQTLTISVPASASLGSASTGAATISGSLGAVTVSTTGAVGLGTGAWTATVVATPFVTGKGSASETIAANSVGYTSGPVTAITGLAANLCTPGQLGSSVSLGSTRVAMSCASVPLATGAIVTWRPTVQISLPASAIAGSYAGTITHSVA